MSSQVKFENHSIPGEQIEKKGKVKLTELLSRLNVEKKRERISIV